MSAAEDETKWEQLNQNGCFACMVAVATGSESHYEDCPARGIPMPEQDGQWGPEWGEYDHRVEQAKRGEDVR